MAPWGHFEVEDPVMSSLSRRVRRAHAQSGFTLRFEWGHAGALAVGPRSTIVVIVDVLSFTTALSVAIDAGIDVIPWRWRDASAVRIAAQHNATLAVDRSVANDGDVTLSPASIRSWRGTGALVLPSPNGSTLAHDLAATASTVLGSSLRNRLAVGRWIEEHAPEGAAVAIIAAGERWPDGSLRPAVEDLWGAGGVIAALHDRGWTGLSAEARVAMAAFRVVESAIADELADCASGRELIAAGFGNDVAVAAEIDASAHVPLLRGDRFVRG